MPSLKHFILDVDGVFTDGKFYYTAEGKVMKLFGPDDHDALLLIKKHLNILMVTGDKKGFEISKKRVETDMHFPLHMVSTHERVEWIRQRFDPQEVVYMGDGIFDAKVFSEVGYCIAPANAFFKTKELANFVTEKEGGAGAVAEACWHLAEKFFTPLDLSGMKLNAGQGEWGK